MEMPMRLLIVAALLLGYSIVPAFGATKNAPNANRDSANYDIEILVFAIQAPEFEGSELWTRTEVPLDPSDAVPPRDLPPSVQFSDIALALLAGGRYRILLEKHWIQSADTKSNVPPILLATGGNELVGTLQFYLSRFLHVELDVMFMPLAAIDASVAPGYVIREQRRVKSNEFSYFDHPKFGVIVRVSPVPT
jgi:hypothetical protein